MFNIKNTIPKRVASQSILFTQRVFVDINISNMRVCVHYQVHMQDLICLNNKTNLMKALIGAFLHFSFIYEQVCYKEDIDYLCQIKNFFIAVTEIIPNQE